MHRRGPFGGLNRKLQVKTVRAAEGGRLEEALLVAKWGGELTEAGRAQAERLGRSLREQLSRADGADNLLHLHSTFRHDVKFYSSDEGRVQLTAAAIAKGLLELAGELPPILVSLIRKDAAANALLDDSSAVSAQVGEAAEMAAERQPRGSRGTAERQPRGSREAAESQPRVSREMADSLPRRERCRCGVRCGPSRSSYTSSGRSCCHGPRTLSARRAGSGPIGRVRLGEQAATSNRRACSWRILDDQPSKPKISCALAITRQPST